LTICDDLAAISIGTLSIWISGDDCICLANVTDFFVAYVDWV
jgi:hypothetical protein